MCLLFHYKIQHCKHRKVNLNYAQTNIYKDKMKNCPICKHLSILLLGIIIGYLIKSFSVFVFIPQIPSDLPTEGSVKVMGQEDAPITITEYSDFQCPLCKKYFDESFQTIIKDYIETGKAKYIFKHFPLNIHPQAVPASLAAECALEQDKFWEMHDELFKRQPEWSGQSDHLSTFKKVASELGLDQERFKKCLDKKTYLGNINADYEEGLNKNVRGTPTIYINNQAIVGAQETSKFTNLIDSFLPPTSEE